MYNTVSIKPLADVGGWVGWGVGTPLSSENVTKKKQAKIKNCLFWAEPPFFGSLYVEPLLFLYGRKNFCGRIMVWVCRRRRRRL